MVRDSHDNWLSNQIEDAIDGLDIYPAEEIVTSFKPTAVQKLRRAGGPLEADTLGTMTLLDRGGVLHWVDGFGFRHRDGRRRGRRGAGIRGHIVKQLKFERLEESMVGGSLKKLDGKLNSNYGIRRWKSLNSSTNSAPAKKGKILLLIHGTFSKTEALIDGFGESKQGKEFFGRAVKHYDQVLSFDHPTVSLNPFLNAVDLSRLFEGSDARIDIICHSRGGLVTRWWAEALNNHQKRFGKVILVGCPLAGTSLAAPPKLRAGMDLLTNVASVIGETSKMASTAFPLFIAVTGIMKVLSSVTKVTAKTPLIDALVAMIPGIAAQSQTGDNSSIIKLREGAAGATLPDYYAVQSDFEPKSPGWAFWRYFQNVGQRVADIGADIVFNGPNDLVVDTSSMAELSDKVTLSAKNTYVYQKGEEVHHLNYFEQPETIQFFRKTLKIP